MKRTLFTSIFSLFFVLAVSATLSAQDYPATTDRQTEMQEDPMTTQEAHVDAVFQEADTNDDGNISWVEAKKAGEEHVSEQERTEKTREYGEYGEYGKAEREKHYRALYERETFNEADEDDNDQLSRNEVVAYLKENGQKMKKGAMERKGS